MKLIKPLLFASMFLMLGSAIKAAETNSPPSGNVNPSDLKSFSGKVVETTNAASYTYVLVDTGSKKLWAVSTGFQVKLGDRVDVVAGMPMMNYHSKSLNRDFELVYFTGNISLQGAASGAAGLPPGHPVITMNGSGTLPPNHPSITAPAASSKIELTDIKRADGGKKVAELYAAKDKLAGKEISVRGKIVKYNAMILGKNWLHIQDGSGNSTENNNDLTITTDTPAALGDTVLVTGKVSLNRDFGGGYQYGVIIENAKVTVEPAN